MVESTAKTAKDCEMARIFRKMGQECAMEEEEIVELIEKFWKEKVRTQKQLQKIPEEDLKNEFGLAYGERKEVLQCIKDLNDGTFTIDDLASAKTASSSPKESTEKKIEQTKNVMAQRDVTGNDVVA